MSTSYKDSRNKWKYIWIAIKHFTTPSKVYEICHHGEANHKNHAILHDLAKYHIIRHRREEKDEESEARHKRGHSHRSDADNDQIAGVGKDRHFKHEEPQY